MAATLTTHAALFSLAGIAAAVFVVLVLAGQIARRNREMTALLDHMEQAFLSLEPDGTLKSERSAMATRLIGTFVPGQKLWEAIAPIDSYAASWLQLGWDSVREGVLPVELSFEQLPKKLVVVDRVYRIEYKPSLDGDVVNHTFVVITDATADVARARAEAGERDLLRTIETLTKDRAGFAEFIRETDRLARRITAVADQPVSDELKRDLHTLKGNCSVYGLSAIAERCHQLELRLDDLPALDRASALEITSAWTELKHKLESVFGPELTRTRFDVRSEDIAELHDALAHGATLGVVHRIVNSWSIERVKPRLERFADQARDLARRLGKGELEVVIADHGLRLDHTKASQFWSAFTHVVRNAVDHGIEPESERIACGKPAHGRLELEARRDGIAIVVELRDDGRGIDWAAVERKAREAGLPAETRDDLVAAILSDGLSTREAVTEISGRGVGLAALRAACGAAGGTIEVSSEVGQGACFRFRFPQWAEEGPAAHSSAVRIAEA
ncbi:MAG: ATP-binding protein [Kofleriaceae bacterium]